MSSETPGHRDLDGGNVDALDELRRQAQLLAERIEALTVAAPGFHGGDGDGGAAGVLPLPVAEDEDLAAEAGIELNSADQLVQPEDAPAVPPVDDGAAVQQAAGGSTPPTPAAPSVDAAAQTATAAAIAADVEEAHRGVRFADLPHPVPKRSRIRVVIWVLVVMALAAGAFYAGSWFAEQQRSENGAATTTEDSAAIASDEPSATADTAGAATPGEVASEDGAGDSEPVTGEAASGADSSAATDTEAEEPTAPVEPAEVLTAAETALVSAGYDSLVLGFEAGTLTIAGVVPAPEAGSGYFNYVAGVTETVAAVAGVENVEPRLFLRGDDVALRSELALLVEEQPIEFGFASADLTDGSRTTLEQAAAVILANPGLRVLVAGHTDASGSAERNSQLAAAHAGAVITELVQLGVPVTRLTAVAYGELFPGTSNSDQENRRVVFEVAP